jgi:putative transposase
MTLIREKKHRFPVESYRGAVAAAFTACIKNRARAFTDAYIVRKCEKALLAAAEKAHCELIVYLFMPDHCHILLQGKDDEADLLKAMIRFKQQTGYWFSKEHPEFYWQKDFYDHILKKENDIEKHVAYILDNPVRKGIVQVWREYPYRGSTVYHLDDW